MRCLCCIAADVVTFTVLVLRWNKPDFKGTRQKSTVMFKDSLTGIGTAGRSQKASRTGSTHCCEETPLRRSLLTMSSHHVPEGVSESTIPGSNSNLNSNGTQHIRPPTLDDGRTVIGLQRYKSTKDVLQWLKVTQAAQRHVDLVQQGGRIKDDDESALFGEALPLGIRLAR